MTGYPLGAVLRLRERQEAAARVEVARALAEEERWTRARDEAAALAAAQRALLDDVPGRPALRQTSVRELHELDVFVERLRREVADLEAAARRAEEALRDARDDGERCRAALAGAHAAVRALERHRDRWLAERGRVRERREEAAAEELVSARRRAEP